MDRRAREARVTRVGARAGGALLLIAVLCALIPASASAICTSTSVAWTGAAGDGKWETANNWVDTCSVSRVPTTGDDVQIEQGGTYIVSLSSAASIKSLTIGTTTSTGSQILLISGGGSLTTSAGVQIGSRGGVTLDSTTGASLSVGTTLTNAGTITAQGSAGTPQIAGNVTNTSTGIMQINRTTTLTASATSATLLNQGVIAILNGQRLAADSTVTVTNATGGQVNGTGTGAVASSGTFNESGGTTTTTKPAVLIAGGTLNYTGGGASSVEITANANVSGATQSGQLLTLLGNNVTATASGGFTNGGTLTLDASSGSVTFSVGSNMLTNSGTLTTQGSTGLPTLAGSLTNTGTLDITAVTALSAAAATPETLLNQGTLSIEANARLTADAPATVRQTAGSTTIAATGRLDVSATGGGFTLAGGELNGGGSVAGSVTNIGATVRPGSTSSPGVLTISGNYLQTSSGMLDILITGPALGSGFSQLSVGGTATLDGALNTNTTSTVGGSFRVLTAGARSGTFSSINSTGEHYSAAYDATGVTLTPVARSLTVVKAGTGSGSVTSSPSGINCGSTCSAGYADATTVTLTETPDSGSVFTGWSGACSGMTTTCQVTLSQDQSVTATFAKQDSLTVAKSGSGHGKVTSDPSGIDCGSTCSAQFAEGTVVKLTATPNKGSSFTGWTGACSGTGVCQVTVSNASSVGASFSLHRPGAKINKTKIDHKAHSVKVSFRGIGTTSGFKCALVRAKKGKQPRPSYKACSSPQTYTGLKAGQYTFYVEALNASGKAGAPSQKSFKL